MQKDQSFLDRLFAERETDFQHAAFDREIAFYESICSGDLEAVRLLATPLCSEGYGILSKDPLQNLKYHFTVSAALIARFCIKNGMTVEESYSLSDRYIMQADECTAEQQVHSIHAQMLEGYTRRMRYIRDRRVYSGQIVRALDYISDHLHAQVRLADTAAHLHISTAYLSRLFRQETGQNFGDYVARAKVDSAVSLLMYSGYSDAEISNLLCFSSQSYFIKLFKKYKGMTPHVFRAQYHIPEF